MTGFLRSPKPADLPALQIRIIGNAGSPLHLIDFAMTEISLASLDQAELLHLALDASRHGNAGAALSYLKEAVSRADATANAHFLLGAEYAQIQMYDRAIAEMESAVALDPSLAIARFQLGLLLLSSGEATRALSTLQPLAGLDAGHPLAHFGKGLMHLIHDELDEALQSLASGMKCNAGNPALNADMQKIIDRINELPADIREQAKSSSGAGNADSHHILVSAYSGQNAP